MNVERDRVVQFHYRMTDDAGVELDTSPPERPVSILYGHGNLIRGVERALAGHAAGDEFDVTVAPTEAYGLRREGWVQRVPKKHLPRGKRLRPGMQTAVRTAQGVRPVTVLKSGATVVDVDMNHPLAGRTLRFEIRIVSVRAGEPDEIAHGHAHGPGGHGH